MLGAGGATGWSHQLLDDFAWLAAHATEPAALQRLRAYDPDSRRHWAADRWAQLAREDGRQFRGLVNVAVRAATRHELEAAKTREWRRQLRQIQGDYMPPTPALPPSRYRCYCGRTFSSVSSYYVHHTRGRAPEDQAPRYAPASSVMHAARTSTRAHA